MTQSDNVFVGTVSYVYDLTQEGIDNLIRNVGATFRPSCFAEEIARFLRQFGVDENYRDIRLSMHNIKSFFLRCENQFNEMAKLVDITKISGQSFNYADFLSDIKCSLDEQKRFIEYFAKDNLEKTTAPIIEVLEFDDEDDQGYFECSIPADYQYIPVSTRLSFNDNLSRIKDSLVERYVEVSMHAIVDISLIKKDSAIISLYDGYGLMPRNDTDELSHAYIAETIKEYQREQLVDERQSGTGLIPESIILQYEDFISGQKRGSTEWKKVMAYFLAGKKWKNPDISNKIKWVMTS